VGKKQREILKDEKKREKEGKEENLVTKGKQEERKRIWERKIE
jgi:hypothetical protein